MKRYYTLAMDSEAGQGLINFHKRCIAADRLADEYAAEAGAVAYMQPYQYFAGGVEFLEFDMPVSSDEWRQRQIGEHTFYEPACKIVTGVTVLTESQPIPADTDTLFYGKHKLPWKAVCAGKSLDFWARLLGYKITGDMAKDRIFIERQLSDKLFVTSMEITGGAAAIAAECKRQMLPVVDVDDFYKAIGVTPVPTAQTPVFFIYSDHYYLSFDSACQVPDTLTPVSADAFISASEKAVHDVSVSE